MGGFVDEAFEVLGEPPPEAESPPEEEPPEEDAVDDEPPDGEPDESDEPDDEAVPASFFADSALPDAGVEPLRLSVR